MAVLAAVLMASTLGVVAGTAAPATASHNECYRTSCDGKWPGKQSCTPGTTHGDERYFWRNALGYRASIHLKYGPHCGAYWGKLVWDGHGYPGPPVRFQVKVERQAYVFTGGGIGWHWQVTHRRTRTIKKGSLESTPPGSYGTRMIPYIHNVNGKRVRACSRYAYHVSGTTYESYGSWVCSSWTTF